MKKFPFVLFALLLALCFVEPLPSQAQEQTTQGTQTNSQLVGPKHRRKQRRELPRRGIRHSYGLAGRSAGSGGKHFGKNIARGKPIKAGRELGRGMGRFGKHVGVGTAKVAKRIVKH